MTKFLKMVTAQTCDTVTAQPSQLESTGIAVTKNRLQYINNMI